VAVLFGLLVGFALGLTGGGGSIFALPLLVYGLGMAMRDAVALSLFAVTVAAAFGTLGALRARLVDYRVGLIFAAGGMLAAPLGLRLSRLLPETVLLPAFALVMLFVATSMWRRATRDPSAAAVVRADLVLNSDPGAGPVCRVQPNQRIQLTAPCTAVLAVSGLGTGMLTGLFGVGGGFVIVPTLMFVTQITIHRAVATSLLVITLVGLSGITSILGSGQSLPALIAALFGSGALCGMLLGRRLGRRLAGARLQKTFAIAMGVVAVVMLISRLLEP